RAVLAVAAARPRQRERDLALVVDGTGQCGNATRPGSPASAVASVELVDRPRPRPLAADVAFDDQLALWADGDVRDPVLSGLRAQDDRRVARPGEQPADERPDDVDDQERPHAAELARDDRRAERARRVEARSGQEAKRH